MSCLPQEDPVLESTADMLQTPLDPEVGHRAAAVVSVTQQVCSQVEAVVVGYDKYFNLMKLLKACSYLRQPTCHFIATNEDQCLPSKTHVVFPGEWAKVVGLVMVVSVSLSVDAGTGCLVQAVAFGSERKPTVMGKPHPPLLNAIRERLERRDG